MKFVIVVVLLIAMVMVLLGISHLSYRHEDNGNEETEAFRREVDEDANVVGSHSLFRYFLARDRRTAAPRHR